MVEVFLLGVCLLELAVIVRLYNMTKGFPRRDRRTGRFTQK